MIPLYWLAKPPVEAKCRWDEQHAAQIILGLQKRVPDQPDVYDCGPVSEIPRFGPGAVVCFPAGAHDPRSVNWLNGQLARLPWVILFLTSDECNTYPVHFLRHPHMDLWVQTPMPEIDYPAGTTFIGEGAPDMPGTANFDKVDDWLFYGQVNHHRRRELLSEMEGWAGPGEVRVSPEFLGGLPRSEYLEALGATKVAPAPAGVCTQDSFRAFEALEMGAIPLLDALRRDNAGMGYWQMVAPELAWLQYQTPQEATQLTKELLGSWPVSAVEAHADWHAVRRRYSTTLTDQLTKRGAVTDPHPITVVVPTSPIPSHPDTAKLEETIWSIRSRIDCEIIISCDGVRRAQLDRKPDYDEYLRRVMLLAEKWGNVTPVRWVDHLHQASMLKGIIPMIRSQYLLYVEHDTPLNGDIDFADLIATMEADGLSMMRFYHEVAIHPEHEHLMLPHEPGDKYVRTFQWSQRPHVARTDWYSAVLETYFGSGALTFIEDVMHGIVHHDLLTQGEAGWDQWRIGIWTPGENTQHSIHIDGREGDPKYGLRFRYPHGQVPPGAPHNDVP